MKGSAGNECGVRVDVIQVQKGQQVVARKFSLLAVYSDPLPLAEGRIVEVRGTVECFFREEGKWVVRVLTASGKTEDVEASAIVEVLP